MSYIVEFPKVGKSNYLAFERGKTILTAVKTSALLFESKDAAETEKGNAFRKGDCPR